MSNLSRLIRLPSYTWTNYAWEALREPSLSFWSETWKPFSKAHPKVSIKTNMFHIFIYFWVELETPPPYPISTQTAAALYHFRFGWVLKSSSWTLHLRSSTVLMVLLSLGKNDARLPLHTSKDFSFLFLRKITLLITFSQHILTAEP